MFLGHLNNQYIIKAGAIKEKEYYLIQKSTFFLLVQSNFCVSPQRWLHCSDRYIRFGYEVYEPFQKKI